MKIVKHCTEQSPSLVTGQLLGLDIGAGTGIIGQALQNADFTNLHALDASANFIETLRERGFYN